MSAKKARKTFAARGGTPAGAEPVSTGAADVPAPAASWIDSNDVTRRRIAQFALIGVWLYVAALWLLALDQWFHWGIFGPKVPPAG